MMDWTHFQWFIFTWGLIIGWCAVISTLALLRIARAVWAFYADWVFKKTGDTV